MSSCEQFSAFHVCLSVLLAFLVLTAAPMSGTRSAGAHQQAEQQAQEDAHYRQQAAQHDAQEQAFCEKNAGAVDTQAYEPSPGQTR